MSTNPSPVDARATLALDIREAQEKARSLHEARSEAWKAMNDAIAWHAFLERASRAADEEVGEARHRLRAAIERETWEAVA